MSASTWKTRLTDQLPPALVDEIDTFETQIELKRAGKIDNKLFAETRLRRGVYGQRYDNGKRHDGVATRGLNFPCGDLTKGPDTVWDAPGMMRIKIPMGKVSADQLDVLAEVAEEYSDNILHVTTRQDIQLHFIHIEDTPAIMRRLGAVDITTREACGNVVRNVTACPRSGVCNDESFDVTAYAQATHEFLLGHKDTQDFGRKLKVSFSGCSDHACGLAKIHDLGVVARVKTVDGERKRGFELYVGGGLGAVPHQAKLFDDFLAPEELLPTTQAICRVFARLGEKKNRARARLKFVLAKLGLDEFRRLVVQERKAIAPDERWTAIVDRKLWQETPSKPGKALAPGIFSKGFSQWRRHNARAQAQTGYVTAAIALPLGDFTARQARGLAALSRRYGGNTTRFTVEQNLLFRWLPEADLPGFYDELVALNLAGSGAGTITDITACPGTDTCKLGIAASRGLTAVLSQHLSAKLDELDTSVRELRIKTSGCFNSCGQHHVADIGYLGVSRNVKGRRVAHFQLVVGGQWRNNGGAYGLAIGAFPAKTIPAVTDALTEWYVAQRDVGEGFHEFIRRVGKSKVRELLARFKDVPDYDVDDSYYTDWGDAREYTIGDMGVGECAGEIVTLTEFGLADSERSLFNAQTVLDSGDGPNAAQLAYSAMLEAAKALIKVQNIDVADDADHIVSEFRSRFHDTRVFHDPYAGAKFANYLLKTHETPPNGVSTEEAHRKIEEAQLFIEAAHSCYDRMQDAGI